MGARLHHELIGDPAAGDWLIVAHGIYGSGTNWRSIARKLVERAPAWGAVLVDLRGHGKSDDGVPPHDIAACAVDVLDLIDDLGAGGRAVRGLCGHSFGGKVMAQVRAGWRRSSDPATRTLLLDSSPSARLDLLDDRSNTERSERGWGPRRLSAPAPPAAPVVTVWRVLDQLEQVAPRRWPSRDDFVAAVADLVGGPAIAGWLAMSLVPDGDGFRLRLVPSSLRQMLEDYYRRDLWPSLSDPSVPGDVHFVVASRSDAVTARDRERAASLPRCTVDLVDAGHWLHVDAPDATIAAIARRLT